MVAIFTGNGTGFERGSSAVLGGAGLLGSSSFGRSGEQLFFNAATGNFLVSRSDEFLVGRGPDVGISRTYNSLGNLSDDNGDNWRQSTDRRVFGLTGTVNTAGSTVKRRSGDGSEITYSWNGSAYIATDGAGSYDKLIYNGSAWIWTDGDSRWTETYSAYNSEWRITAQADTSGNTLAFSYYAGTNNLYRVTTADGGYEQYDWSGSNITQIVTGYTDLVTSTAKTLTRTRFSYDGYNRLATVTVDESPGDNSVADGNSYLTTYSYHGTSKLVAAISQTDGSYVSIGYDGSNRVTSMVQTVASGVTRTTSIAYGSGYTQITDPAGQVTTLYYNGAGALTQITAPPAYAGATAQTVQFGYNGNGDLTSATGPAAQVSSYTYDSSGNILTSTDPLGNVVTRTYSATNRVLTETRTGSDKDSAAAAHTTRYAYDSADRLTYTVTAEGRVTRYWYLSTGENYWINDFPDQIYDVSALGASVAVTDGQLNSWAAGLSGTSSTEITYMQFDARGNMARRLRGAENAGYAWIGYAGGYSDEYFTYDQAGQLLSRYTYGQATETFVYDGLGRLTASTDLGGGVTTYVFSDAATQTTVTLANGFVQTSTYNKAGEIVSFTESGSYVAGGTASYAYDKLGRLRTQTDASGFTHHYVYDKVGRKIADVNQYGFVTEYRYDANNRLVATARYTNALSAGQLALVVDPNSTVEMAALRPAAHPYDLWSWTVYDADGRVIETIEGDGSVKAYTYDASDRLVKTTGYFSKLTAAQVAGFKITAPASAVLPTAHANDSVARVFYDKDGNRIGVLDGEGYLTRTLYDKAGRKVQEVAFANATNPAYRASGTFQNLIDSVGTATGDRTTRYVYDGEGQLRYKIDGLGGVIEFGYESTSMAGTPGVARKQISYAATLGTLASYTYAAVKAAIASAGMASNTANRTSWAVYNTAGLLAYSIDAGGAVVGYTYDNRGQVTKKIEYATLRATASLPSQGDMDSWAAANTGNAANRVTRSYYSARGELRFVVDAEGFVTRNDYDAEGRLVGTYRWDTPVSANDGWTIATVEGSVSGTWASTTYGYDAEGRVALVTDGEGNHRHYWYYANGLQAWDVTMYGTAEEARTLFVYDGAGRVSQQIAAWNTAEQAITYYSYDGQGNLTTVTDPLNHSTTSAYDKLGQLKTRTDAAGGITSYDYDAFGDAWKVTDPRGFSTYSWYDKLGRATHVRNAADGLAQTSYTVFGEVASVTHWYNPVSGTPVMATPPSVTATPAEDATTTFAYDKLGRVITTTDARGFYESYGYDAFGNRTSATAKSSTGTIAAGLTTTYTFNRRGQLLTETLPVPTYDSAGNAVSSTIVSRYEYDARGNLTKRVEADNLAYRRTTTYVYDKNNRLTEARGDVVSVIADDLVTASNVTPTERFKYDARGNIIETTDAGGARTLFYYDDLNRKTVQISQTSATENRYSTFTYDASGNVTLARAYAGSVTLPTTVTSTPPAAPAGSYRESSFTYDALNRQTASQVSGVVTGSYATGYAAANLVTNSQYDANGNVIKLTDPNGGITYVWYDALSRKTARVDAEGALTTWAYDPDGNVTAEMRFANRVNTQTGSPVTLATLVTTAQTTAVPALIASTGYNDDDRYTTYTYDKAGNRLSETRYSLREVLASGSATPSTGYTAATVSYLYNGLGQVVRKTEATLDQTNYTYDGAGRLITEARAAFVDFNGQSVTPTTQYLYNGLGDLSRTVQAGATGAAARATTYSYGAGGRLTSMTDASGFTRSYAYDAMGRVKKEYYSRATAAGGTATDAIATRYDLAGRRIFQGAAAWNGSSFAMLDYSQTQYNGYGDVWKAGVNGLFQTENLYDNAGRLAATTAGDGVWKFFGYDKNGNQTVVITSAGASLAGQSFASALSMVGLATVNAAYTSYDKRNLAVQVLEEGRQLSAATTDQLITTRTYNSFGEVASETNALGATINYSYNNMGRLVKVESPTVAITLENGTVQNVRPTEIYYYDISGRVTGSRSANGALSRQSLLAGTGYGGSGALTVSSYAPDGGAVTNAYDVHGDIRRVTDQVSRVTTQSYDAMGRVTEIAHFGGLTENYAYDGLGQRIQAWNNQFQTPIYGTPVEVWVEDPPYWNAYDQAWEYGGGHYEWQTPIIGYAPEKSLTEYDAQGRVTSQLAFGGDLTTVSYAWNSSMATSGLGTFGGWTKTTTFANSKTSVESSDIFGRMTARADLGGHVWSYSYDIAGRLTAAGTGGVATNYLYFNTGQLSSTVVGTLTPVVNTTWSRTVATYSYDKLGQKLTEQTNEEAGYYTPGYWQDEYDPYYGYVINSYWVDESYYTAATSVQNSTASYDALGRLKTFAEAGTAYSPAANIAYEYDANGNVRRTTATYRTLDQAGTASSYATTTDYWFRYDSMNRLVTDRGVLRSGQIVRGESLYGSSAGQDIQYNAAGERVAVIKTQYSPGYYDYYYGYYYTGSYYESRENYIYNTAGRLYEVQQSNGAAAYETYDPNTGLYTAPTSVPAAPTTGTVRSRFTYDTLGRQITQNDYEANGTTVAYSRSASYNNKSQLVSDYTSTKKSDGHTYQSSTSYDYGYGTGYALGSALTISTINYKNNNNANAPDTLTTNSYAWWDGAVQASIAHKPNTSQSTTYYTSFYYNGLGQLTSAYVGDARPRSVTFRLNAEGQIIRRDETDNNWSNGDPHEVWYRFNGRQLGYTGNNGTSDVSIAASIAERGQAGPTGTPGPFRGGLTYGSSYADFTNSYDPINSYSQGSSGGTYTVRAGDTLQGIAQAIWGDSSLWYKLAEANGLSGAASLAEGTTLVLPGGVIKSAYNSNTLKPYNPADAIGDVSPTTPAPQAAKKKKCGVLGMILLAVIAIAVTVVTAGAALAAAGLATSVGAGIGTVVGGGLIGAAGLAGGIAIGAGAAAVGSIVSQGIGVATGIQEKFSWKAVGMAAIGGGVTAGIGGSGIFNGIGSDIVRAGVSAAVSSALTQGIGVATGLQKKFDWVGVAAAGVGAMAGQAVFGNLPSIGADNSIGNYAAQFGKSAVNAIANAATRSALEGTSFGANIAAAIPDVVAQTIGSLLFSGIKMTAGKAQPVAPPVREISPGQYEVTFPDGTTAIGTPEELQQISLGRLSSLEAAGRAPPRTRSVSGGGSREPAGAAPAPQSGEFRYGDASIPWAEDGTGVLAYTVVDQAAGHGYEAAGALGVWAETFGIGSTSAQLIGDIGNFSDFGREFAMFTAIGARMAPDQSANLLGISSLLSQQYPAAPVGGASSPNLLTVGGMGFYSLGLVSTYGEYGRFGRMTVGSNWRIYPSGWRGNQYVTTGRIAPVARVAGRAFVFGGQALDTYAVINGDISVGKYALNTAVNAGAIWGGPVGVGVAIVYYGVDYFYPGGWDGVFRDAGRVIANVERHNQEIYRETGQYPMPIYP